MSDGGLKAPVVAILDWRAAAALTGNAGLLRRAGIAEAARRRHAVRAGDPRSLLLRADGSAELGRFTAATTTRRLAVSLEDIHARKAGTVRRG